MTEPTCQVTEEIKAFFDARTEMGLKKYGVTMDRNDLSLEDWMQHLIEELADAIQYAWRAKQMVIQVKQEMAKVSQLMESAQNAGTKADTPRGGDTTHPE